MRCVSKSVYFRSTLENRFIFWNCRHRHELSSCNPWCNPDSSSYVVLTSDTPRGVRVTAVKLVHTGDTTEERRWRGGGDLTYFNFINPNLKTEDFEVLGVQLSALKMPECNKKKTMCRNTFGWWIKETRPPFILGGFDVCGVFVP